MRHADLMRCVYTCAAHLRCVCVCMVSNGTSILSNDDFLASVDMQEANLSTSLALSPEVVKADSSWFWLSGKVAWMCMCDVKGGRLLRWQVLKAAARERGYQGPTTHQAISKDAESAQAAWMFWLASKGTHLTWFHCKLEVLLEKDKFRGFRRSLLSMKEEGV